jgi:hypothetical protein
MSSITLPHNKERIVLVLLPFLRLKEGLNEVIGILANHFFVGVVLLSVGIAHVGGLIEPQDVSRFRPGVGVDGGGGSVFVYGAGSVFGEEGEGGGAARSACRWRARDVI